MSTHSNTSPLSKELWDLAIQLADTAGQIIRPLFRSNLVVQAKEADSPIVTDADRQAELAMRQIIEAAAPAHAIIGEEFGTKNGSAAYTWILDPVDGTISLSTGKNTFTTLIALMDGHAFALGVIDQPVLQERWIGGAGQATTLNGVPVKTKANTHLQKASLSTTTPDTFRTLRDQASFERLRREVQITSYGGDCYHFGLLASGHIDLIIERGFQLYDFAPLVPIVEGAGGVITDWQGRPLTAHSRGDILASANRELHDQALAIITAGGCSARNRKKQVA